MALGPMRVTASNGMRIAQLQERKSEDEDENEDDDESPCSVI
jgi:hypothetical protein